MLNDPNIVMNVYLEKLFALVQDVLTLERIFYVLRKRCIHEIKAWYDKLVVLFLSLESHSWIFSHWESKINIHSLCEIHRISMTYLVNTETIRLLSYLSIISFSCSKKKGEHGNNAFRCKRGAVSTNKKKLPEKSTDQKDLQKLY